jgi:quercetin dioxygenase-like cupin family protein
MLKLDDVVKFIHNPLAYEQKLVSIINTKGEIIPLSSFSELYGSEPKTVKIEGMEKYSPEVYRHCEWYRLLHEHTGPITCHVFIAQEDSPSFPMHTDPDDVIIYCCDGRKSLDINGQYITLEVGESITIPANTPHRALNEHASMIMSIGLEKYLIDKAKDYELDNLPEDDGDLQP